jgi:rhodanese-related sulfurtransferase
MNFLEQNWPIFALILWFGYKWWSTKQVVSMLPDLRKRGAIFVDVRSDSEFSTVNAPGTINIPIQELKSRAVELPKDRDVVLCCASGSRSGMAKLILKSQGFKKVHNVGTWSNLT